MVWRFEPAHGHMKQDANGNYVAHIDYVALKDAICAAQRMVSNGEASADDALAALAAVVRMDAV